MIVYVLLGNPCYISSDMSYSVAFQLLPNMKVGTTGHALRFCRLLRDDRPN